MEDRVVPRSSKRITQKYKKLTHKGVDIGWSSNEENNKIYANCEGVVYEIQDGQVNSKNSTGKKSWGNFVYIKHPNGMFTRYAHLKTKIPVKVGQSVDENTIVGIMGNTGNSYGRHLHFEVATGYSSSKRINPEPYLTKKVYTKEDPQSYTGEYPKLKNGIFGWKRGDKNKNVGLIQKYLNWCLGCHLAIDNSFGNLTEKQVKVFQKKYGLIEDGKVGPRTIKIMKTIKK